MIITSRDTWKTYNGHPDISVEPFPLSTTSNTGSHHVQLEMMLYTLAQLAISCPTY